MGGYYNGSITAGTSTITAIGYVNLYLLKNDLNGNGLWVRGINATVFSRIQGVASDPSGNVIIAGFYGSNLSFGTYTLNYTPSSAGGYLVFIAKYSPSGNLLWTQKSGGTSGGSISGISTDAVGNSYLLGAYSGTVFSLGTYSVNSPNPGKSTVFVAKCDPNGNIIWIKNIVTPGVAYSEANGQAITTDASGNSYISGFLTASSATLGSVILTNTTSHDIFMAKYDSNGNVIWANTIKGYAYGNSISYNGNAGLYLTGLFADSLSFGTTTLTCGPGNWQGEMFVAKYNTNGNFVWAKGTLSPNNSFAAGSAVCSGSTGAWVDLQYGDSTSIGTYTFTTPSLVSCPNRIIKFDPNGNIVCSDQVSDACDGFKICNDPQGNAYIGGYFDDNPLVLGSYSLAQVGMSGSSIFAAKYSCGITSGITTYEKGNSLIVFPNPFANEIFVNNPGLSENSEFLLFNSISQEVLRKHISQGGNIIETGGLPPGIYIYTLFSQTKPVKQGKLVKD